MSLSKKWVLCCACQNKVKNVATQVWVEDEVIVEKLKGLMISHGYCPECYSDAIEEIGEYKKSHSLK